MQIIRIKGMKCPHCQASAKKALEALEGIRNVEVDLEKGEARFDGDVPRERLQEAIVKIGFELVD